MTKQISGERKTAYYLGVGLMVIGGLLFFSVFPHGTIQCPDEICSVDACERMLPDPEFGWW